MKALKEFFAQIDWVRNTFFFVFYFFMVSGVFIGVMQPSLEIFRQSNAQYRKELYVQTQIEFQRNAEQKKLFYYREQNVEALDKFSYTVTQQDLEEQLKTIFANAGVVADGIPMQDGKYKKQRFIVSGSLPNIARLKDALNLSEQLPGVVHFNFPIHIERETNSIVFSFRLDTYFLPN